MKKLVIAFSLLMVIAGGTISVLKWLGIGPFANIAAGDVDEGTSAPEPARYVDMDPLVITIFQGNKVAATIQIQVKLEARGEKNEKTIYKIMPRLSDAFFKDLHAFIPRLLRESDELDAIVIKQRLKMVSDKVAGKGTVSNILIQSVVDIPARR